MILEELSEQEQNTLAFLKSQQHNVFVTGAGGFLGSAICRYLRAADISVVGYARGNYPSLEAIGVTMIKGDITDSACLNAAMAECGIVIHVASKAGVWGSEKSYFGPNVDGVKNVIAACENNHIDKLIYTSTPSVTFAGEDENGIDESAPYAEVFLNHYGHSKAIAEQLVLAANSEILKTVALRPHLIWGPNDPHLVPRVVERAKAGKLKLVGNEDKLVDTIYVDNAAFAHLLAAEALYSELPACAGKCYFLSNDEPVTMANMLNRILKSAGLPSVSKRVPSKVAFVVGSLLESFYRLFKIENEPMMTKFVAKQLSTSHYFDITAAKRDLKYKPIVSMEEGMSRLSKSLR